MLTIVVPGIDGFNEKTMEFVTIRKPFTLRLEHSLVSLTKWEEKWEKPFLHTDELTIEESIDYVRCMTITQNVPDDVYNRLTQSILDEIRAYIGKPMTATRITNIDKKSGKKEIITAEVIYYWMITLGIPVEFQKWHLNKLITLIEVCSIKSSPPKKMGKKEALNRRRAMNAARKKRLNTKG